MSKQDIIAAAKTLAETPDCEAALSHLVNAVFACDLNELPPIHAKPTLVSVSDFWRPYTTDDCDKESVVW